MLPEYSPTEMTDELADRIKAAVPEIEPDDADHVGPDDEIDPNAEGVRDA